VAQVAHGMNRTVAAFLIAPLWAVAATVIFAFHAFPHSEQQPWIYITVTIGAAFAYGGTAVLGIPAFLFLRRRQQNSFWIAVLAGFVAGAITWNVFFVLFGLSLENRLAFIWQQMGRTTSLEATLFVGVLGSAIGATLWLIARPDLKRGGGP
jgi:hypothetical protein